MNANNHHSIEHLSSIDTDSLPEDGGPDYNRLVFAKSPYLLQHATNPIDWRTWNTETIELARQRDIPIFLSIGYSTCHWCHVMADESFADHKVAEIINRNFVAIKVDREERPDIDATYMQACQAMTGSGGWPLTLVLTPALKPFFAATYIPKNDRGGMTGLTSLLQRITSLWQSDREKIDATGNEVYNLLKRSERQIQRDNTTPDANILHRAINEYQNQYDSLYSGFGQAPKFPAPHNLSLLLRLGHRFAEPGASKMALETLRSIRLGGIYDQLGGGIHRYSVDERWLVPHFEKMLYDQGLLILACIDAWQQSGDRFYGEMALDTAAYVTRKLTSDKGGFFCGEDADSEGSEGTSYLWETNEVREQFSPDQASNIIRLFGMREEGNFEGRNILYLPEGLDDEVIRICREKLLPIREKRIQPHLDDKIITAWNGLAIAALARLARTSGRLDLAETATRGARFIREHLYKQNRLLRRWRQGDAAIPAFLEDYAFLAWGLLELYQARFVTEDLAWAIELSEGMLALFTDGDGGLFDTGHDAEMVLVRGRDLQDGALPSGNSTAAMVLARLGLLTGREEFSRAAKKLLANNGALIERHPTAFSMSLIAVDYLVGPSACLALTPVDEIPNELLQVINDGYHPRVETILSKPSDTGLERIAPVVAGKTPKENQATAWLCEDHSCQEPTTTPGKLAKILKGF